MGWGAPWVVQSLACGFMLLLLARRPTHWDVWQAAYAAVWTTGVLAIARIAGAEQRIFYSTDQATQVELLARVQERGIWLDFSSLQDGRYAVVLPAWVLTTFGLDPLLAFKFIQAVTLTFLYRLCRDWLERQGIAPRLWHTLAYAGPLFVFLSVLGLRDLVLAYAATHWFVGRSPVLRAIWLGVTLTLRPHLVAALLAGWVAAALWARLRVLHTRVGTQPLALLGLTLAAWAAGAYSYGILGLLKYDLAYHSPSVWWQHVWWRFFANLVGLQFLTFGDDVVAMSIPQLVALRVVFVDTLVIPILFLSTLPWAWLRHSVLRVQVYASFVYFLGLVAQTRFNSSRQNLPFFAIMGLLALVGWRDLRASTTVEAADTVGNADAARTVGNADAADPRRDATAGVA
jgi:hypothetical protein